MLQKLSALILCLSTILILSSCSSGSKGAAKAAEDGKVRISVTFNALKEFAQAVGKDKVEITTIIPDGTEPHDFEPRAKDFVSLGKADIFIYNGLGMESWAKDAVKAAGSEKLIEIDASKGIIPIQNTSKGNSKGNGQYDPHIWLSPKSAETEVRNIKDALVRADPSNKDYYEKNCADYTEQLESLFTEYSEKFKACEQKSFVTGHAAFAYLCRDFSLKQNSLEDVFAEGEPSAQQLTELSKYCRDNKVTTVFAEKMASPAVSETLAKEVGAKVETVYTIESGEDNKNYLERITDNLSKIFKSLSK